ncbi:MAG: endonuclease domain-containing protein [Candidatus Melainabacteria bacterium]
MERAEIARMLRQSQTEAEKALWRMLRGRQLNGKKFYRQRPIDRFVVDFYCPAAMLIVELDGSIHDREDVAGYDEVRQSFLEAKGFKVIRIQNDQVFNNPSSVKEQVMRAMNCPPNSPSPLGGEGAGG